MLSPQYPAAVVAGNVETSQAVTNCLFGALGALSAAQGTMNNLNFGNAKYQYYETICSGSPAGPGFPGTDAVHTHMTNTRLTDPSILEFRYPVVLEDFHIRKGSGGRGKWNAGDGVRRTIRFLETMDCTILSGHRRVRPFALAGGEAGQVGENSVRRTDGRVEKLQGCDETVIEAGEAVIIQTPTAGGYGSRRGEGLGEAREKTVAYSICCDVPLAAALIRRTATLKCSLIKASQCVKSLMPDRLSLRRVRLAKSNRPRVRSAKNLFPGFISRVRLAKMQRSLSASPGAFSDSTDQPSTSWPDFVPAIHVLLATRRGCLENARPRT